MVMEHTMVLEKHRSLPQRKRMKNSARFQYILFQSSILESTLRFFCQVFFPRTPNCSPRGETEREREPEFSFLFPQPRIPNERLHASTEQPASRGWVQVGAPARSPRTGSRFRRWTPRQDPRGVGAPADPATPAERHHLQSYGDLPDGDRGTGPNIFQKGHRYLQLNDEMAYMTEAAPVP